MREQRLKRILLLSGSLLAVVTLLGACSTKTPTAPLQAGGTVVILPTAQPTADFETEAAPGDPNLVMFNNLSTDATSFFWEFGDGATSQGESPLHRYARFGTYTVRLTATNGNLNDIATQFLKVGVDLVEPTAVIIIVDQNRLTVIFSALDCAECRYSWKFGDGTASSQKDPVHTYQRLGTYTVSLTFRNEAGSDTATVFVTVPKVEEEGVEEEGVEEEGVEEEGVEEEGEPEG
jgi:PKD repeat protein